ncbi:MAG TPA: ATPase domain-containing protein [Solirubrobacteraceae bacterium]|jgi:circadian clock protein KaiC|nr:ATPase domain-containing protein [Solirubrobacteraceae bacterium]
MSERFSSGDRRIDAVLGGGLPANAVNMIIGLPGSGKTILAEQFMFHNASPQRPGMYLSTVSEPLEKILRYGERLAFFDPEAIGTSVFFDDLGDTLNDGGLSDVLGRIRTLITDRQPGVIVIDSFKALSAYAPNLQAFRHFLQELAGILTALPTTTFWVGEYASEEIATAPEFAVADGIISLTTRREAERAIRHLEVLKLRGTGFMSGEHTYRISHDGLHVFPRLAESLPVESYALQPERMSSGIAAIDEMLADGYWPGASTMIAGPSGSGKTLMGLHFIFNGAATGQTGVIATLQENSTQLDRIVAGFGWSLADDSVELMYRSPVDLYLDEWFYELLEAIDRTDARRVFIDSLGDLRRAAVDELRFREYLYSLLQRCANRQISVMMSQEVTALFGISHISEDGISHLSDNVILLQFVHRNAQLRRAVTVLKTRASRHDPDVREFQITPHGIVLDDLDGNAATS